VATLDKDQEIVEQILEQRSIFYAAPDQFRTLKVFDHKNGSFLLMDEGWEGYQRIHRVWAHIELRDGKFLIHEDGTQEGLATDLMEKGVARERIVLAFQEPRSLSRAA
jgi:hypothetical protein